MGWQQIILALLDRLLGIVDPMRGQVADIWYAVTKAVDSTLFKFVADANNTLQSASTGLVATHNAVTAMAASHTLQDVLDAIGAITPTPPAPPPTSGENALAVWNYLALNATPATVTMDQLLSWAGQMAANLGSFAGFPFARARDFMAEYPWPDEWGLFHNYGWEPTPDYSDVLADDTVLSWLNRTDTTYAPNWQQDTPNAPCYVFPAGGGARPTRVWCLLAVPPLASRVYGPPVWPGLANVTLGTPVALSPGVTIATPMDGILVAISAVAAKQMYYTYDDQRAYRHIGAFSFFSDNAEQEAWQSLGFVSAVYCPRFMTRAAGVKIMTAEGTVGTVTPWVAA